LKAQGIVFPEIAEPKPKVYQFDAELSTLFYHTVFYLTDDDKIQYYRYQAIKYLKPELRENYYEQAILVSQSLAGIMKTLMIKRLESSFTAFKSSLNNLTVATGRMIEMFAKGKVLIAPDLSVNDMMEKGFSIEEIEGKIAAISIENPRNNVFSPDDFDSDFIDGLRKDHSLLQELVEGWSNVEQDPKLDTFLNALKDELLNQQINPTGKLVVFTESTDTANYLTEKVEEFLGTKILNVSSENRSRIFETIQENFDANYEKEHKNDYNIIITTDVLAEGVNLHRANVIVNYDTPWNATRLMQRIGRVNRIGSVAGVIYNYNFYPSQQGNEEIHLYRNALIKLQGFHSAFGEDAQIYTHEEMLEQFELFNEGLPDDEDKRLHYLRFIREFKDNNPKEFKRIKAFPLKARTARKNGSEIAKNSTIIFLKSPYKTEFYQSKGENQVMSLTFLEAAQIFEAQITERPVSLPENHYVHVQAALKSFDEDFLGNNSTEKVTITDQADAHTKQALKFLRDFNGITHQQSVKETCQKLQPIVESGTYTPLANELAKLSQKLNKREITLAQVDNLLIALAKKYDVFTNDEEETQPEEIDTNIAPEIVLSETFID
ncbi:MAG: helicase, partial [Bacteroidetes bacterium]|nr:helicase [Bacteroidota bacterium]